MEFITQFIKSFKFLWNFLFGDFIALQDYNRYWPIDYINSGKHIINIVVLLCVPQAASERDREIELQKKKFVNKYKFI